MNLIDLLNSIGSLQIICLAFLAILFLQSGLDKVFDFKGNKQFLMGHFENSPLRSTVGILLPVITLLECAAGAFCAVGVTVLIIGGTSQIGLIGTQLAALSIICLFFGQRVAKDYAGAESLATYFVITVAGIWLMLN